MKSLEARLKSWVPRRPSAKLEREWSGAAAVKPLPAHSFAWLAPAAACALFAATFIHQRDESPLLLTSEHKGMVALSLSNQSYAAYLPDSFQQVQNRWDTFAWTNGGGFNSSKHPFSPAGTEESNGR